MLLSNLTSSSSACAALLSLQIQVVPVTSTTTPISYHPIQSRSATCTAPVPYPSMEPQQVHTLPLLVEAFVQGVSLSPNPDSERIRKGDLHFLSSVFANISTVSGFRASMSCSATVSYGPCSLQSPAGRLFFLTPSPGDVTKPKSALEYPLSKIVPFTEHHDTIRRRGVASVIK